MDIVERLRLAYLKAPSHMAILLDLVVCTEAADEIERLRARDETAEGVRLLAVADARSDALEEAAKVAEVNNLHWVTGIDRAIRDLKEKP